MGLIFLLKIHLGLIFFFSEAYIISNLNHNGPNGNNHTSSSPMHLFTGQVASFVVKGHRRPDMTFQIVLSLPIHTRFLQQFKTLKFSLYNAFATLASTTLHIVHCFPFREKEFDTNIWFARLEVRSASMSSRLLDPGDIRHSTHSTGARADFILRRLCQT